MRRQKALLELRSGGSDRRSLIELFAGTRGRFRRCVVALAIVVATLAAVALPVGFAPPAGAAAPPVVTGVSPNSGPLTFGNAVTISGSGFTGATSVHFGTTVAGFTFKSDSDILATAPAGVAGTVNVTVTTPAGTSATSASDQYTYFAVPVVSGVSPTTGPTSGGTSVTISGSNFVGASSVQFGTAFGTGVVIVSNTQITATSPAHAAGTVDVTVITPGGTSATSPSDHFRYIAPVPTVSSVAPSAGPAAGGTSVTITGTGFTAATAVAFGFTAATTFAVVSDTQITATSPAHAAATVNVTVTTAGGTSATSPADDFTFVAAPTVGSVAPTSGPTAGGTSVTITGTNFTGATAVHFGTTAASGFTVVSATQITATSPCARRGHRRRDRHHHRWHLGDLLGRPVHLYRSGRRRSARSHPTSGPTAGGTSVTITGTGFTGGHRRHLRHDGGRHASPSSPTPRSPPPRRRGAAAPSM